MRHEVEVRLERDGSTARFCVTQTQPAAADALAAMGFQLEGGTLFRSFPDSDDVPRIFANFRAHIDEMISVKVRATPAPWEQALEVVAQRLSGRVAWTLAGSSALRIRGVDVRPRDIDLVVEDAGRAGELLNDLLIEPVTRMHGWVADWFGRAFDGPLIEWVAGVHTELGVARAPATSARRERVVWRGHEILCTPLDLELPAYEARGLSETVEAIRSYLGER